MWNEFDRLVKEGKLREAQDEAERLLAGARESGDDGLWAAALVHSAQAGLALSGFETVAGTLREAERPAGSLARITVDLFYGNALVQYAQAYSWMIQEREYMGPREALGIENWTRDQIRDEALAAYLGAWSERAGLGALPVERLAAYIEPNNYPRGIRGTLRDSLSYLFAEMLADSSMWSARQTSGAYRLDLDALLTGDPARVDDDEAHPLERMAGVLADLEAWHREAAKSEAGRSETSHEEAALEAALERRRRLFAAITAQEDRLRIRQSVEALLEGKERLPWWSSGMATLAEMVREESEPDRLALARDLAAAGAKRHPESLGAAACRQIVASLEASDFHLAAMQTDAPGKRSIEVQHRNLSRLYFRAYSVDLRKRVRTGGGRRLMPDGNELVGLLGQEPARAWQVDLPATPDLRHHRTFVTPETLEPGAWVVLVSDGAGFRNGRDTIDSTELLLSEIVLLTQGTGYGAIEVTALDGGDGTPLAGIELRLMEAPYGKEARLVDTKRSDAAGRAHFKIDPRGIRGAQMLVAEHEGRLAYTHQLPWGWQREETESTSTVLYTDRSIYRPGQTVHFKALLYASQKGGDLRPKAGESLTVTLLDPNGEEVASSMLSTNAYGTAGDELIIPAGRPLGSWSLRSSHGGGAAVRVEEYKRPSFEVEIAQPATPLRLNREATLAGEARYLFGLPVTGGRAVWRVVRQPMSFPWWFWYRPIGLPTQDETLASGDAELGADGRFEVRFTPLADERLSSQRGLVYDYRLEAEITDEAGETRTATRHFRIGLATIEATLRSDAGFLTGGESSELRVERRGLNGEPAPGRGRWQLFALEQPAKTLLPAEQPLPPLSPEEERYATPGDRLRARWDTGRSPEEILRSWPTGKEVADGTLETPQSGMATLALPALSAGAYRLRYRSEDAFGAEVEALLDLLVAPKTGGAPLPLALPALLRVEHDEVAVGGVARLLAASGLEGQPLWLEIYRQGQLEERRQLKSGGVIELPVGKDERGGFAARLTTVRDHQLVSDAVTIRVPWRRDLEIELATFRDRMRPGDRESWRVVVRGEGATGRSSEIEAAELLAYMYDRSLDQLAPHSPPVLPTLFPSFASFPGLASNLGAAGGRALSRPRAGGDGLPAPLRPDRLTFLDNTGIGGPGRGGGRYPMARRAGAMTLDSMAESANMPEAKMAMASSPAPPPQAPVEEAPVELRSDFAETAFWQPHLLTGADGSAAIEFTVPDSVTSYTAWFHALTRDLRSGSRSVQVESAKELMVRPYLPRFLRQGDRAELKVSVDNTGETVLAGEVRLEILDPTDESSLLAAFGVGDGEGATAPSRAFRVEPGSSTTVAFPLTAPRRLGPAAFKVTARSGNLSDGELRPLPVLPARFQLVESRFAALAAGQERGLTFERMAEDDPTREIEQLVVTVDAQLFQGVLAALPYLVETPYEHTPALVNRYAATAVLTGLFDRYPQVAALSKELAKRDTQLEAWRPDDPNRRLALEETPWLALSRGGYRDGQEGDPAMLRLLDPAVSRAERTAALARLQEAQLPNGAFPWWSGGPPSNYMTAYVLHGLARALEFGADVPKPMVVQAWSYLATTFNRWEESGLDSTPQHPEVLTFMLYVASSYPDSSWLGDALPEATRKKQLDRAFAGWRPMPPYLKALLALTLHRAGRAGDARLVLDSILDSARSDEQLGLYWAPEERAWLWYNDTIEGHAFVLTALNEILPDDERRHGLVQWLFLNKKLNQWGSSRSTAEVVEALARYLEREGTLGAREEVRVQAGGRTTTMVFAPDRYTGKSNQVVLRGSELDPARHGTVEVENLGPNRVFASATWHLSTEELPAAGASDLFGVERRYFRRVKTGDEVRLEPLGTDSTVSLGDEVEVQLTLSSRHAAEFVHLRDPRPAGFEPGAVLSGWKWDLGLVRYEEIRDSGTNFFIEWMPAGTYTLRYRLRAATDGTFRSAPAVLQSLYAPEFAAYSAGATLRVGD